MKRLLLVATAALSVSAAGAAFADETNFPARHRTLESTAPSSCGEWVAPLPDRRVKVSLPYDARKREGMARVTFTIGPDGSYAGLVSAQTNDAAFVQAAEQSLQYWTFKAARCNGVAVPIEAEGRRVGELDLVLVGAPDLLQESGNSPELSQSGFDLDRVVAEWHAAKLEASLGIAEDPPRTFPRIGIGEHIDRRAGDRRSTHRHGRAERTCRPHEGNEPFAIAVRRGGAQRGHCVAAGQRCIVAVQRCPSRLTDGAPRPRPGSWSRRTATGRDRPAGSDA